VNESRRFSHAIAEGDGISLVASVEDVEAARSAEAAGAEGVLLRNGYPDRLTGIRGAVSLPVVFLWDFENADVLAGADACIIDVRNPSNLAWIEQGHVELADFELALRVTNEEQLEAVLEQFDPELFVLAGDIKQVYELLAEVPAGKLVLAEPSSLRTEDVEELERAGVDAVIVDAADVASLVGDAPLEV
jgi:NAD(P)H-dependent flavin oxidoreductase YrpB (nitropropane dioxygenase family)